MNKSKNKKNQCERRKSERILGILFSVCLIAIIIANILTPDKTSSEMENRSLTQKPQLTVQSIQSGSYMKRFESYMSDQFAGRNSWRNIYTAFRYLGGSRQENGILLGKGKKLMEDITVPENQILDANLSKMSDYAANYAETVNTFLLLVPDAAQIQKNDLPVLASVSDQKELFSSVEKKLSGPIKWIDGITAMEKHADEKLYYETDHHWTTQGAYAMFLETASELNIDNPSAYVYQTYPISVDFNGTLASSSGFCLNKKEQIDIYIPEKETPFIVTYVEEQKKTATIYDSSALKSKDQYAVFLGGNYPLIDIETASESDHVLLLVKDSFANSFLPFLIAYYKEIIVIDPRYYAGTITDLMDTYKITDTLFLYSGNTFFSDNNIAGFLSE